MGLKFQLHVTIYQIIISITLKHYYLMVRVLARIQKLPAQIKANINP